MLCGYQKNDYVQSFMPPRKFGSWLNNSPLFHLSVLIFFFF